MKHSLGELFALVSAAGIGDPGGFPLRATLAAIASAEGGDPNAWVEHDPPSSATAPPSSGLYQVNRGSWPEIYEQTERVRRAPISDKEKILGMTALVQPIVLDALQTAATATRTLAERGIRVSLLHAALFMDATWQAGSGHLARWSKRTRTGDPSEIVNPTRTASVEASLRRLAPSVFNVASDVALVLGVVGLFGLAALILSRWKP